LKPIAIVIDKPSIGASLHDVGTDFAPAKRAALRRPFSDRSRGNIVPLAGGSRSRVPPMGSAMLTLLRLSF
jgi:hypothetical protein